MNVDGALGPAGGSGRVEPIGHVAGGGRHRRPRGAGARQHIHDFARSFDRLSAHGDQIRALAVYLHGSPVLRQEVVIDDQRLRPAIRQHKSEILGGQTGADRHRNRADTHDAEKRGDENRAVLQQQQRPVAFSQIKSQRIAEAVHLGIELVIGYRLIAEQDRDVAAAAARKRGSKNFVRSIDRTRSLLERGTHPLFLPHTLAPRFEGHF